MANRIAEGTFDLNGQTYELEINNGPNTLHGGKIGFDKKIWDAKVLHGHDGPAVEFHYLSPDMEENFPGNLDIHVTYTLTDTNELRIDYKATTDKKTIVNLTNHSYWNLSACKSATILDEVLYINADKYTPVDDTMIPTGKTRSVVVPYCSCHGRSRKRLTRSSIATGFSSGGCHNRYGSKSIRRS